MKSEMKRSGQGQTIKITESIGNPTVTRVVFFPNHINQRVGMVVLINVIQKKYNSCDGGISNIILSSFELSYFFNDCIFKSGSAYL